MNRINPAGWPALLLLLLPLTAPAAPPTATPEKVKGALPELEKLTEQLLKKTGVPGAAVAIVYRDEVVYLTGFGLREVGKDERVDADTVFQLASVSKPLATTTLATLVGDKVLRWDDRVIDHDPAFRLPDPWVTRQVTLRDLLCHRSGLPDHAGDVLEDLGYGRGEILRRLRFLKPSAEFRAEHLYTNFGFTAAAVAGARAAGKSWEDLAADKLYRPLGMTSTSSRYADYAAAKNRAVLHVSVEGKWLARHRRDADAQSPAGGASSSVRDLTRWLRMLLALGRFEGKPVVAADALAETFRPQSISAPPKDPGTDRAGFYGLGWVVSYDDEGRVRLGHSGGFALGGATAVSVVPSEDLAIAVLTNGAPIGVPETINASFLDLVLHGKVTRDWDTLFAQGFATLFKPTYGTTVDHTRPPAEKSPPLPPGSYSGPYHNDYVGEVQILEKEGNLQLRVGPKGLTFPLRHRDRDVFVYQPEGESAYGLSGVIFTVGPDRRATSVLIENLDVDGRGTFTRVEPK
jgi:CubicO group peptidase (beta-lactamase class C family)